MKRRQILTTGLLGGSAALAAPEPPPASPHRMKITRLRLYEAPRMRLSFNQSFRIVTVETDAGITGIGEGGTKDTFESCAQFVVGQDPSRIEHLWQLMYRGAFYPAGRERLHALGAIDMALWDIKGQALGVPVHSLLGGLSRDHVECYSTNFPSQGSLRETARACIEAGFRAYRTSVSGPGPGGLFDAPRAVRKTLEECREIREGVGPGGDWAIDYHTRLDLADAVRMSALLEELDPLFVEDPVRSENPGVYRELRGQVRVPLAVGEQYGDRWDTNELIEQRLIDYTRVTLPNTGGITEYVKLAALCETHYVGLIPHNTGPVSEAALVHVCGWFPGPVVMEMRRDGSEEFPWAPLHYDLKNGKLWPNERPGLGVEFDPSRATMVAEVTGNPARGSLYRRPDGSITNW